MEILTDMSVGCYFTIVVSGIVFIFFALAKRAVVHKKDPRPWNQDPDDYDSKHNLF